MKKNIIISTFAAAALIVLTTSCANDKNMDSIVPDNDNPETTIGLTAFASSGNNGIPLKRTSMGNHHYLTGCDFYWEPGDHIYVKDDNNAMQNSGNNSNISATQPTARFRLPGKYTANNTYEVYYTGVSSTATATNVTIATAQTQTTPNTAKHIVASGDCGTAKATRVGDHFEFMLDHKASYLCFLPRITNAALGQNVYLTKIVVKSNNAIAGDYTLSLAGLSPTPTGNAGNEITLTTSGTDNPNGFPLNNTATSVATNAAYMVIAPGTHTLTVEYYIKDPVTNVEGTITKNLPADKLFEANKVYDVTANLTPKDYTSEYYTAEQSETFNLSPNNNLMVWYAEKGAPHWDTQSIYSTQGHLYCQGMWYKKASVIAAENGLSIAELNERDPLGNDLRPQTFANLNGDALIVIGCPSLSEINNWFYVPSLGYKFNGTYTALGIGGLYFTANTQGNSVGMHLSSSSNASRVDMVGGSNLQMPLWFGESSSPIK